MTDEKVPLVMDAMWPVRASLRIMATTDLHSHVLAWDYYGHRHAANRGLSRIATLVAQARAESDASILLDNGDFLAGSGLSDFVVRQSPMPSPHPMIAAMNCLGYDAVNLGNHEFSHGLPFLRTALQDAKFPVLCTNFDIDDFSQVQRAVMIARDVQATNGQSYRLQIGIMGLLPVQTMAWEEMHLHGHAKAHPMAQAARAMAHDLRSQGADVVIALAHTGLASQTPDFGEDHHANIIADISEIDAVIAGHSHQVFPDETAAASGKAIVLPGFFGSHLGVVDLDLHQMAGRWRVQQHRCALRAIAARDPKTGHLIPKVADTAEISALAEPWHSQIMEQAQQVVGQLPHQLHSYFATLTSAAAVALVAQAQADYLARILPDTADAGLPILAAAAPFKTGDRGGPENYTDLPAGPFRYHHAVDLYMHPNSFVAFRLTGAEVALWLERSVSKYNQIQHGAQDAALFNPEFPGFNCDMIFGVTYEIDLSQPAMFDASGRMINLTARRIRNLCYQGQPLRDDQVFALASNSYRRNGVSGFAGTSTEHVIFDSPDLVQDIVRDYVASGHPIPKADPDHWRFVPQLGSTVLFDTAPHARAVLQDIAHLRPHVLRETEQGFTRFRLHL